MDTHMNTVPTAERGISTITAAGTAESPVINELAAALAKAQGAFSNPAKDRENPYFGSRYATLGAVIEATRGPLADNGLSLTQTIGAGGGSGRASILRTRLLHASGQWIASEVPLFAAGKGSQVFGSELTYMRRYAVCALLNIAPAEGDDGGNAAQAATGTAASASQALRGEQRSDNGGDAAARAQASSPARQRAATPSRAAAPQESANAASRRRKDEPIAKRSPGGVRGQSPRTGEAVPRPPSVWGILRPGKAAITAPDGAAWLKWWTSVAAKATAEDKLDELQALYEANVVAWDEIAIGSAEAHDVVAEAAQAVRAALGD